MKNKNYVVFILVTLVLVMFAVFALKQETKTVTSQQAGKKLFPGLQQQVNDVTRIITRKGDKTVTIAQQDGQWQVVEKDNYPASLSRVKQTILAVADLGLFEEKTRKAENYKKLQVEDATEAGATSTLVTLEDKEQKSLASVIAGKQRPGGGQPSMPQSRQYVRKAGDEQVWLVQGELKAEPEASDWLDTDLVNVASKRISRITFTHPTGKPFSVYKAAASDANFAVADMPKGKKLKSGAGASKLANALQNLKLTDVSKAAAIEFANDKSTLTSYQTFDGMIISASTFTKDDTTWLKLSARFDASLRAVDSTDKPDADKSAAPEMKDSTTPPNVTGIPDITTVQQEVSTLNAKLEPWVFQVSDASIELMTGKLADLIEDVTAK